MITFFHKFIQYWCNNLYILIICTNSEIHYLKYSQKKRLKTVFGQRPQRGQSPVEHRGLSFVRLFIRPSIHSPPPGPLRPETCPLRPRICLLRPEICPLRPWIWEGRFEAWADRIQTWETWKGIFKAWEGRFQAWEGRFQAWEGRL